jgi:hypothetical protein
VKIAEGNWDTLAFLSGRDIVDRFIRIFSSRMTANESEARIWKFGLILLYQSRPSGEENRFEKPRALVDVC